MGPDLLLQLWALYEVCFSLRLRLCALCCLAAWIQLLLYIQACVRNALWTGLFTLQLIEKGAGLRMGLQWREVSLVPCIDFVGGWSLTFVHGEKGAAQRLAVYAATQVIPSAILFCHQP